MSIMTGDKRADIDGCNPHLAGDTNYFLWNMRMLLMRSDMMAHHTALPPAGGRSKDESTMNSVLCTMWLVLGDDEDFGPRVFAQLGCRDY
jgi:hypothetical protein